MTGKSHKPALCFIDSNIWPYALVEAEEDVEKTVRAKRAIEENEGIISTQVINEVCVNLLRKDLVSEERIQELVADFYDKYVVVEMSKEILLKGSELRERHHFSFWDSTIVASALQSGARFLYSEDMHNGLVIEENLTIVNPL
jgi:predicted nucleic acid-binding protein